MANYLVMAVTAFWLLSLLHPSLVSLAMNVISTSPTDRSTSTSTHPGGGDLLGRLQGEGDIRKTDFTLKWRVPDREAYDIAPGATQASSTPSVVQSATVYERVQLRRAASEQRALEEQVRLESSLHSAQQRISVLEEQLRDFRAVSEEALVSRDRTIAQMAEQTAPQVQTIYVDRPVPPAPLEEEFVD